MSRAMAASGAQGSGAWTSSLRESLRSVSARDLRRTYGSITMPRASPETGTKKETHSPFLRASRTQPVSG